MRNYLSKSFLISLIASLLTACSQMPPKCSDEATLELVKKIVADRIAVQFKGYWSPLSEEKISGEELLENMRVELPRADALDEKIKKYSCAGKLVAADKVELPITYESQLDDKNAHVVAIARISQGDLHTVAYKLFEGVKERRATRAPAAAKNGSVAPIAGERAGRALEAPAPKDTFASSSKTATAAPPTSESATDGSSSSASRIVAEATAGKFMSTAGKYFDKECNESLEYETEVVDLNGDGQPEVFTSVDGTCLGGMGGVYTDLFIKDKAGRWKPQFGFPGIHNVLKTKNLGYPDIEFGGPGACSPQWRWNGQKYDLHKKCS